MRTAATESDDGPPPPQPAPAPAPLFSRSAPIDSPSSSSSVVEEPSSRSTPPSSSKSKLKLPLFTVVRSWFQLLFIRIRIAILRRLLPVYYYHHPRHRYEQKQPQQSTMSTYGGNSNNLSSTTTAGKKAGSGNYELISRFCGITGAPTKDAQLFLDWHKSLDNAINAYYENPHAFAYMSSSSSASFAKGKGNGRNRDPFSSTPSGVPSTEKMVAWFESYKDDPESSTVGIDGTIKLCGDLDIDPEDVVMLAVAYDLDSKRLAEWNKEGWLKGMRNLRCDSVDKMRHVLPGLREKLGKDSSYFKAVYKHTFEIARSEGQRSLGLEHAQAFWKLLLPHGLDGGALSHVKSRPLASPDEDVVMDAEPEEVEEEVEEGWRMEYNEWWIEYSSEKMKGVNKDTWMMFIEFVRSVDSKFTNYDPEGAWPSAIDGFVAYARKRLARERKNNAT